MRLRMVFSSQAVVDTSFWSICCRLGIASELPSVWPTPIKMPGAVLGETFAGRNTRAPHGLFVDQLNFLNAFAHDHIKAVNAHDLQTTRAATGLDTGERAVIDVALEDQSSGKPVALLINERPAYTYAKAQGLTVFSVPDFLVVLLTQGILTLKDTVDVFQRLDALHSTPKPFIETARTVIRTWGGRV